MDAKVGPPQSGRGRGVFRGREGSGSNPISGPNIRVYSCPWLISLRSVRGKKSGTGVDRWRLANTREYLDFAPVSNPESSLQLNTSFPAPIGAVRSSRQFASIRGKTADFRPISPPTQRNEPRGWRRLVGWSLSLPRIANTKPESPGFVPRSPSYSAGFFQRRKVISMIWRSSQTDQFSM